MSKGHLGIIPILPGGFVYNPKCKIPIVPVDSGISYWETPLPWKRMAQGDETEPGTTDSWRGSSGGGSSSPGPLLLEEI